MDIGKATILVRGAKDREHEQCEGLGCVLGQTPVAHRGVAKLAVDDPKRVPYLGTDTGFGLLDFVEYGALWALFIQYPSFARSHRGGSGNTSPDWSPNEYYGAEPIILCDLSPFDFEM